jgi:Ni,Fe-hydrogenase III component G
MDPKEEKDPGSAKLTSKSKEYTPKSNMNTASKSFVPTNKSGEQTQYSNPEYGDVGEQYNYDELHLQWVNHYMNQGATPEEAQWYATQYLQNFADLQQQDEAYGEFGEFEMGTMEEVKDEPTGDKSKKPHGEKKKGQYKGEHNEKYDGTEEGAYDELGFYYMPDGSYYDPDGYYFDINGYDQYGGYYDDNAIYHSPDDFDQYKAKNKKFENQYEGTGEEEEDKYTPEYIKYIIESKYYEDFEYLKNTKNEWAYLKMGNLPDGTTKKDVLKYLGNSEIETKQITIMMSGPKESPIANCEIYKIPAAIQVLKLCGNKFGEKQVIIEVDHDNEKLYNSSYGGYYDEIDDQYQDRYTKFDQDLDEGADDQAEKPAEETAEAK